MTWKKPCIGFMIFLACCVAPFSVGLAMPKVERTVLANKLPVLVFEDHSIPAVTFQLLVSAGSWRDPPDKRGAANLTVESLPLGTRTLSFDQISNRLDFIGASFDTDCGKDFASIGMQMLKKDLDGGFELFFEIISSPSFPESEVAKEKDEIMGAMRATEDRPMEVANRAFDKALFSDSPYAGAVEGTEESLAAMDRETLERFYNSFYRPNNAVLVIGGDITPEEVKARIVPKLLEWQPGDIPETQFHAEFFEASTVVKMDRSVSQASIVMGGPAIDRLDKDYYAFSVLNHILGSGNLSSRLASEIRVRAGLAYAVESVLLARRHAGSFRILIQTKNSSAREAIALAMKEEERLRQEPVSEKELELAKKFLIGNFPLRYGGTQQNYAQFVAQVEFYGLGGEYAEQYPSLIGAVTSQDILRVAGKYLSPDNSLLVIVADLEKTQMK